MRALVLAGVLASGVSPASAQPALYGIELGQPISVQFGACQGGTRPVGGACWTRDEWPDITDLPNLLDIPRCLARGQELMSRPEWYYRIRLPAEGTPPSMARLMALERDGAVQVVVASFRGAEEVQEGLVADLMMRYGKPTTRSRFRPLTCGLPSAERSVWVAQWQAPEFVLDFDGAKRRIVLMSDAYAGSMAQWEALCTAGVAAPRWGRHPPPQEPPRGTRWAIIIDC
jgi:hypothetical protein